MDKREGREGRELLVSGGSQNLSRESMLFSICRLKTGDTAGRGGYEGVLGS